MFALNPGIDLVVVITRPRPRPRLYANNDVEIRREDGFVLLVSREEPEQQLGLVRLGFHHEPHGGGVVAPEVACRGIHVLGGGLVLLEDDTRLHFLLRSAAARRDGERGGDQKSGLDDHRLHD